MRSESLASIDENPGKTSPLSSTPLISCLLNVIFQPVSHVKMNCTMTSLMLPFKSDSSHRLGVLSRSEQVIRVSLRPMTSPRPDTPANKLLATHVLDLFCSSASNLIMNSVFRRRPIQPPHPPPPLLICLCMLPPSLFRGAPPTPVFALCHVLSHYRRHAQISAR